MSAPADPRVSGPHWTRHPNPFMYAFEAHFGNRTAEVIRAYQGEWFACAYIDGAMCKPIDGETRNESYSAAKTRATRFLTGQTTPEVWNNPRIPRKP